MPTLMAPRLLALVLLVSLGASCGSSDESVRQAIPPGNITGQIFISDDVPARGCLVLVEGTPLSGRCDENGHFDILRVPPGPWDLVVLPDNGADSLPRARMRVGVNAGQYTTLSNTRLTAPGAIAGRVQTQEALADAVVIAPELGVATLPAANGAFLLEGVAPGMRNVQLLWSQGSRATDVQVRPRTTLRDVNFDVRPEDVATDGAVLEGTLAFAGEGDPPSLALEVFSQRHNAFLGIKRQSLSGPGSWKVELEPGVYTLRASAGGKPPYATLPLVVLTPGERKLLSAPLIVLPDEGDIDRDGTPDAADSDADGDGHAGEADLFPLDPAEWKDTDGDGLGDRADLFVRVEGQEMGPPEQRTPPEDTDDDGSLDFEDNCPDIRNDDQKDSDGDTVGDACESCPGFDDRDPLCEAPYALSLSLTGTQEPLVVDTCSRPVTVELRGNGNQLLTTARVRQIALRSSSPDMKFFEGAGCGGEPVGALTLTAGSSSATFSFKDTRAGVQSVEVYSLGLIEHARDVTLLPGPPVGLGFISEPHNVEAGVCGGYIEVGTVDAFRNATPNDQPLRVSLKAAAETRYFLDDVCSDEVPRTAQDQVLDIPAGARRARFYFLRAKTGAFAVSVSLAEPANAPIAQQVQTVRPTRPGLYRFVSPTLEQRVPIDVCTPLPIQVSQLDIAGNERPWTQVPRLNILLTGSNTSGAELFLDPDCTARPFQRDSSTVFSTPVPTGTRVVSFYVKSRRPETLTLYAGTSTSESTNTYIVRFSDIDAARLELTEGDTLASTGLCVTRNFRITRYDRFGNLTSAGGTVVTLSGTGATFFTAPGAFDPQPRCTEARRLSTSTIEIPAGKTSVEVNVIAAQAGRVTLTASAGSLTASSKDLDVITPPTGLSVSLAATAPVKAGTCTAMTVAVQGTAARDYPISLSFGGTLSVYSSCNATSAIYSHTLPVGTSSAALWVRMGTPGSYTVNVTASISSPQSQPLLSNIQGSAQLTVEVGDPSKLAFSTTSSTHLNTVGNCSGEYRVRVQDAYGNNLPDTARNVTVVPSGGNLLFYRTLAECEQAKNSEAITGNTRLTLSLTEDTAQGIGFFVRALATGTHNFTVQSQGLTETGVTSFGVSSLAPPKRAFLLAPPASLPVGVCRPVSWVMTDFLGNLASFGTNATVAWPSSHASLLVYSSPDCETALNNLQVSSSASGGTLYVKATAAGQGLVFNLAVGGLPAVSHTFSAQ